MANLETLADIQAEKEKQLAVLEQELTETNQLENELKQLQNEKENNEYILTPKEESTFDMNKLFRDARLVK